MVIELVEMTGHAAFGGFASSTVLMNRRLNHLS